MQQQVVQQRDEAIELGARGRYAQARYILDGLIDGVADGDCSLAWSTIGSHARQLGASGAPWDQVALATAASAESESDALIGLAADAVTEGAAALAYTRLEDAARLLEGHDGSLWRPATRWHWVSAEVALLQGDRDRAYVEARAARRSCAGRSSRHEAKSMIVAMATGDPFALSQAPAVAQILAHGGWASLQWPLGLVLADAPADQGPPESVRVQAMQTARVAVGVITAHLPEDLADAWHSHPGVRRILAGPVA